MSLIPTTIELQDSDGFRFGVFNRETGPEYGVINSPYRARQAVRFNIKHGADVFKSCASGGVLSPTDDVDVPQLSQGKLNALVDEAHTAAEDCRARAWRGSRKTGGAGRHRAVAQRDAEAGRGAAD